MRLIVVATLPCVAPGLKLRSSDSNNQQSDVDVVNLLKNIVSPPNGDSAVKELFDHPPPNHETQCDGKDTQGRTSRIGGRSVQSATFFEEKGDSVHCYNFDVITDDADLGEEAFGEESTWVAQTGEFAKIDDSSYTDWLGSLSHAKILGIRWSHITKPLHAEAPPSTSMGLAPPSASKTGAERSATAGVIYLKKLLRSQSLPSIRSEISSHSSSGNPRNVG